MQGFRHRTKEDKQRILASYHSGRFNSVTACAEANGLTAAALRHWLTAEKKVKTA